MVRSGGIQALLAAVGIGLLAPCALVASDPPASIVVVVRHAEKDREAGGPDPALTEAGRRRARDLDRALEGAEVRGLLSTPFRRTRDTLAPLAARTGLPIVEVDAGEDHVAATVRAVDAVGGGVVVVSGHSDTVPAVLSALSGVDVGPIADHENDRMFVVVRGGGGPGRVLELRYGAPSRAPSAAPSASDRAVERR